MTAPLPSISSPQLFHARTRAGGLLLALASILSLLGLLLGLLVPAGAGDSDPNRAAQIVKTAAAIRSLGALGMLKDLVLAMAASLLAAGGADEGRRVWSWSWRGVLVAAALWMAMDLFQTFALVAFAHQQTLGGGLYQLAGLAWIRVTALATLLLAASTATIFAIEFARRPPRIESGWLMFGAVTGAIGAAGAIGALFAIPRLALAAVIASLGYFPLARFGIRLAARPHQAGESRETSSSS